MFTLLRLFFKSGTPDPFSAIVEAVRADIAHAALVAGRSAVYRIEYLFIDGAFIIARGVVSIIVPNIIQDEAQQDDECEDGCGKHDFHHPVNLFSVH